MNRTALACVAAAALQFLPAADAQSYTISTVAGNNTVGFSGDGSAATSAQLSGPYGVAVDASGNLYIADQNNQRVREVQGVNINTIAGNGTAGYMGDAGKGPSAELFSPLGVTLDSSGNIYIADFGNNVIRKLTSGGIISTVAGNFGDGPGLNGDNGPAVNAQLNQPTCVAVDSSGNLYIADFANNKIRKVDTTGKITTIAGTGSAGYSGDGLLAKVATLYNPSGVAVDASGNIYIADAGNNRVRKINGSTNIISTIAGTTGGFSGDYGPAISAKLNRPVAVAVDSAGNVYIADSGNSRIRMVTTAGSIITIAGNGSATYQGDGGPATSASLSFPTGVALDKTGKIYIADVQNNVIRMLTPVASTGNPPSINGAASASGYGALSVVAPGSWMEIYGSNLAPDSRLWTGSDFTGVKAPTSLDQTMVYIAGQQAFVEFISGNQVNVQVPSSVSPGTQSLTLVTPNGIAGPLNLTVNSTSPGLLAPASFNVGGKQYVVALFTDGKTYVLPPNTIAGVTSRQAHPGETIVMYGVGFGTVSPNTPAGQIVQGNNSLTATLHISFGQSAATLGYAGLATGEVGLYQFNVVVPAVATSDTVPLTFTLNGTAGTQTLYTAIQD